MTNILIIDLIIFICAGYITGMLSALLGIGGGLVAVPVMFLVFKFSGMPAYEIMHIAIGTSLAIMLLTSARVLISHHRLGNILWCYIIRLFPWMIIGALAGALVSRWMHSDWLRYLFMVFLLYVIYSAVSRKSFTQPYTIADFHLPRRVVRIPVMIVTGVLSVWLGIGGSVVTIPFLRRAKMPMVNATAAAVGLSPAISVVGVIGYIWAGWHSVGLPAYSLGYINGPAFVGFGIGSILGVPLGAKIAMRMEDGTLAKCYIGMLVVALLAMMA